MASWELVFVPSTWNIGDPVPRRQPWRGLTRFETDQMVAGHEQLFMYNFGNYILQHCDAESGALGCTAVSMAGSCFRPLPITSASTLSSCPSWVCSGLASSCSSHCCRLNVVVILIVRPFVRIYNSCYVCLYFASALVLPLPSILLLLF